MIKLSPELKKRLYEIKLDLVKVEEEMMDNLDPDLDLDDNDNIPDDLKDISILIAQIEDVIGF